MSIKIVLRTSTGKYLKSGQVEVHLECRKFEEEYFNAATVKLLAFSHDGRLATYE